MSNVINLSDWDLHLLAKPHDMQFMYESETIRALIMILNFIVKSGENKGNYTKTIEASSFFYKRIFNVILFSLDSEFIKTHPLYNEEDRFKTIGYTGSVVKNYLIKLYKEKELEPNLLTYIGYIYGTSTRSDTNLDFYIINPKHLSSDDLIDFYDEYGYFGDTMSDLITIAIEDDDLIPVDPIALTKLSVAMHNVWNMINLALYAYDSIIHNDYSGKKGHKSAIYHITNLFQMLADRITPMFTILDKYGGYLCFDIGIRIFEHNSRKIASTEIKDVKIRNRVSRTE